MASMAVEGSKMRFMKSLAVLNIAAVVERMDEQILPSVYFYLGQSLHASLPDLGALTLSRAFVQALASPLTGVLSNTCDRTLIIAAGCVLWGLMTSLIGMCTSLRQAMFACALNGLGLALVVPTLSSLVADLTRVGVRGRAFGVMGCIASVGGMLGALFATNLGGKVFLGGLEGWRGVFHIVAGLSLCTAWLVRKYAKDPTYYQKQEDLKSGRKKGDGTSGRGLGGPALWRAIQTVLKIPSFKVIVLQGIVGSIPWQAMAMMTLWLQLLNFSNWYAAMLTALFTLGCALGGLLGGIVGDAAAKHSPFHGRIAICQISVLLGLPLSFLLFKGLPLPQNVGANGISKMRFKTFKEDVLLAAATVARDEQRSFHHTGVALLHQTDNLENGEDLSSAGLLPAAHAGNAALYALVLLLMGLSISWCGSNNSALFAELVPEHLRTHIYAFDRSFEGAVGAMGAPLVGIAAERVFGFGGSLTEAAQRETERAAAAKALSSALVLCLVVPWTMCFFSYMLLHVTYPKDRNAAAGKKVRRVESMGELLEGGEGRMYMNINKK